MNKLSVLIVEDDAIQSKIVENRLRQCGVLSVEVAFDGQQALSKLVEQHFDLLLIDVLMDSMDGIELLNELHIRNIFVPFYITSAIDSQSLQLISTMAQQFKLPILGALAKPLSLDLLQQSLQNLIPSKCSKIKKDVIDLDAIELTKALDNDELQIIYSPVKKVKNGQLESIAVSFLWKQENIKFDCSSINTNASNREMANLLVFRLMKLAFEQVKLHFKVESFPTLSFNVSMEGLAQAALFNQINDYFMQQGIHKSCLVFDINEQELAQGNHVILPGLTRACIHGYDVAISKIKKGYQSLLMIRELPVSVIKLDPSLVSNCDESIANKVLISSLIGMAKIESIKSIAVGVERIAEIDTLRSFSCDSYQSKSTYTSISKLIES